MIRESKHKWLEKLFLRGSKIGIQAKHAACPRLIQSRFHASTSSLDLDLPGLNLHELTGSRTSTWLVKVSENWKITFEFRGEDAYVVDCKDYH